MAERKEEFVDAVDWSSVLKKKEEEVKELKDDKYKLEIQLEREKVQTKNLKRDLYKRERDYKDLWDDFSNNRKRLQHLERKETEMKEEERRKRVKLEKEEEIKRMVRIEEEEREKVREEIRSRKSLSSPAPLFFKKGL